MVETYTYNQENLQSLINSSGFINVSGIYNEKPELSPPGTNEIKKQMLINLGIVKAFINPNEINNVFKWYQMYDLIKHLSNDQIEYFESNTLLNLSLFEIALLVDSTYILAWSIDCIDSAPFPNLPLSRHQMEALYQSCPSVFDSTNDFINKEHSINTMKLVFHKSLYDSVINSFQPGKLINKNSSFEPVILKNRIKTLNWVLNNSKLV